MTAVMELEIRMGELRLELAPLTGATEKDTDAIEGKSRELRACQVELNAARILEPEPETRESDRATTEMRALELRASVGDVVHSVLNGGQIAGAMAELQKEKGLASNEISIRQLIPEQRAVTPAPGNVAANQQPIRPYVFPDSVGAFLGVDMPTVGVGEAVFPVLTSALTVGTPAENAVQAETTGSFSADVLQPARLQASFFYSREDRAKFAGMDASLRDNLAMGLADGLDAQIIAGTNGLLTGTNLANHNVTAEANYNNYRANFLSGRIDGRYASDYADLRIVMGAATFEHADSVWRGTNTNNDVSALDVLRARSGGLRVSAHVPAPAANNRQDNIIRLGMNPDMVAPTWENIGIIDDQITKADAGQIVLTAVMLHAVKILRVDGFHKQQVQNA